MRACALIALLLSAAAPAAAQAGGLSARFEACVGRAGNNIVQRGVCGNAEMGAQDDRLNKAYQQVMRQLTSRPAERIALRDRQRSWIKERDYSCKVNGETIDAACIVTKTAARADELEAQVRF